MHREVSPGADVFERDSNVGLYLLTGLIGFLIGRDLAPPLADWLGLVNGGPDLTSWGREWFGFRFAMIAAVIGGARVLFHSLEAAIEGRLTAELAIAVAAIAAILIGEPLVAAEVVFIGLAGECLEAFTFDRARRGVRKLVEVFPLRCWVLRDGRELRIFTYEVGVGDRVVVKPGGKIPVDGVVVDGRSAIDACPLTGESMPLDRGPGDDVLAGSINQFGQLIIEAKKIAEYSVAGQVIQITAQALQDKAPLERQVDRLARWFLPTVLGIALVVFILNVIYLAGPWRPAELRQSLAAAARLSIYPTLGVLVVACPCALVLATPAAVIAALGRLAGTGVLVKGGAALERLSRVQAFAFDKTGTLTEGQLELGDIIGLDGVGADEVVTVAAAAEQGSEHPLGQLLVREARARTFILPAVVDFQAQPGAGVSARVDDRRILVGTRRLLEEQGVALSTATLEALDRLDQAGQSSLLVARDGDVIGMIGARDRIRPDAADVLQELRNSGIARIAMLSGDRAAVARAVAEQLKIEEFHAELLPAGKAAWVASRPETAFVGDGINDAPALATAAVGIAVGGATDLAAETGDIIVMGEPLGHLPMLLRLSRETVRIIRQNIVVFAFGVNIAGIVLTGLLWPIFASSSDLYDKAPLVGVLYHQLGSLLVLLNSMRLLAFERAAGKTLASWKQRIALFDLWMERNLRFDNLLHQIAHRGRAIGAVLAIAVLAAWLGSGLVVIEPDEAAVVEQFGRVRADLGPGLHWRWPWPIDAIRKVKPDEVKVVLIDFRPGAGDDDAAARLGDRSSSTWTSVHGDPNRPLGMSVFTGDRNLIDVLASIQYTIDDPRQFLYSSRQPQALLRSAAEGALREIVAGRAFMDLLTAQRLDLQEQTAARLKQRLRELAPHGIGIKVAGVVIHDMHPVLPVAKDYYHLARAIQEREQQRHRANATAALIKSRAVEEEIITVNTARRDADQVVEDARAGAAQLHGWQEARGRLGPEQQQELLDRFKRALQKGESRAEALARLQAEEKAMLAARRALIDFNLTWDAIAGVLKMRNKVIVDAEQVHGKVQMFVIDPDLIRPALLFPKE